MARAGVVLERDGVCRNSHLSPKGHARHTRHADHTTTNLQVKAPSADLSGSLGTCRLVASRYLFATKHGDGSRPVVNRWGEECARIVSPADGIRGAP